MKLKYLGYIAPVLFLISLVWMFVGTPTIRINTPYEISKGKESFGFVVTDIRYERTDEWRQEGIQYTLYPDVHGDPIDKASLVKYIKTNRDKKTDNLEKVEGSTKIVVGSISFAWSYKSDDEIYLYLEDGAILKRIKDGSQR